MHHTAIFISCWLLPWGCVLQDAFTFFETIVVSLRKFCNITKAEASVLFADFTTFKRTTFRWCSGSFCEYLQLFLTQARN